MSETIRQQLVRLIRSTCAYIESEKEDGRRNVEVTDEIAPSSRPTPEISHVPAPSGAQASCENRAEAEKPLHDVGAALADIAKRIAKCTRCELSETRTHTVPGQGAFNPEIMFIGEGPGEEEDKQGLAFVGRAGQLLTRIIEAMGYKRDEVFIGNIVKCRPPGNRTPYPHEMEACMPFLEEQIAALKPKVIVALGGTAVRGLLHTETGITKLRGQWMEFRGIPVMPTYHPAYLLRNEGGKKFVWADMLEVLKRLGRTPPSHRNR